MMAWLSVIEVNKQCEKHGLISKPFTHTVIYINLFYQGMDG